MTSERRLEELVSEVIFKKPFKKEFVLYSDICPECGYNVDECFCGVSYKMNKNWLLIDKMADLGYDINIKINNKINVIIGDYCYDSYGTTDLVENEKTLCTAICMASLAVFGVFVGKKIRKI